MSRRFIALISVFAGMLAFSASARTPNVIVILADDQGWGDLSVNGNTNLATPNIDSLARDGATFDRFYVQPVCSPTRAEFLTGRYATRGGVYATSAGGERLNLNEQTIADVFRSAGYATGAFGKWHNGTQFPYHPNGRGFDEFYGFCSGHWGNYFSPPLERNGQPVKGNGFLADDLTNHALGFVENAKADPFFCFLALNTPHSPMQVPDEYYAKFADSDLQMRADDPGSEDLAFTRAALAMCENIDWNVGRILQRLEDLDLVEDTIVIYFSDNGPNGRRWNGGMKGIKGSVDEGGVRSPFFIRWPGQIEPGKHVPEIAGAIDLLPTLADCAEIELHSPLPMDGVSLKQLVLGEDSPWPDRLLFSHWRGRSSVRSQRYRMGSDGRLFDMESDPGQKSDISDRESEVAAGLSIALNQWERETANLSAALVEQWKHEIVATNASDERAFPVGYPEFPITQLPARDGKPHGNVTRSNRYPNDSFFQNWTSLDDSMTWNIEVANAGEYEVTILYTCAAENVGSVVELAFNGSRLKGSVTEPNDPPLRGAENDRVPRGESYVKDFKPMKLGVIELSAGRGLLSLKAVEIPGESVMDVRAIHLTLTE